MTTEQKLQQTLNLIIEQDMAEYGCQYLGDHPERVFNILSFTGTFVPTVNSNTNLTTIDRLHVWDINNEKTDSFSKNIKYDNLIGKPITLQIIIEALKIKYRHIFDESPKIETSKNQFLILFGKHEIYIDFYNKLSVKGIEILCEIFEIK